MSDTSKKVFWNIAFFVLLLLLAGRIVASFYYGKTVLRPIFGLFLITLVLVSLFLLEGLQVTIAGLKNVSHGDIHDAVSRKEHIDFRNEITSLHKDAHENFYTLVTGGQVLVTLLVIGFDKILPLFSFRSDVGFFAWLDSVRHGLGKGCAEVLSGHITGYIMSAFLLCWLTQLAPGSIADKSSLAFMKFRFTKFFLLTVIRGLGMSGVGAPGNTVVRSLKIFPSFRINDAIHTGPATVFNFESSNFGFFIRSRDIHISVSDNETWITEESVYCFKRNGSVSGVHKTRTIQHAIMLDNSKISGPILECFDWSIKIPTGVVISANPIFAVNNFTNAPQGIRNLLPEEEAIVYLVISFEDPLPRQMHEEEQITITTICKLRPLNFESRASDIFCFEVAKPTGAITFTVEKNSSKVILGEPTVFVLAMDELYHPEIDRVFMRPEVRFSNDYTGANDIRWKGEVPYPLLSSRIILELKAQWAHPSS